MIRTEIGDALQYYTAIRGVLIALNIPNPSKSYTPSLHLTLRHSRAWVMDPL